MSPFQGQKQESLINKNAFKNQQHWLIYKIILKG